MTAPAINPAMNALPGLAGGGNAQAATGPLAGFEALLAALFGETDTAGAVTGGDAHVDEIDAPTPEDATAPETVQVAPGAETLLNSLLLAQAAPNPAPSAGAEAPATETAAPPAWGQDKATAAPADPAVAQADAHAHLPDTAGDPQPTSAEVSPPAPPLAQAAAPTRPAQAPHAAAQPQTPTTPSAAAATDVPANTAATAVEPEAAPLAPPAEPLAQATARDEITRAADAAPPPPAPSRKDKKAGSAEHGKDGEEPKSEAAGARSAGASATPAAATAGGKNPNGAKAPEVEPAQPEARRMDAPEGLDPPHASETRSTTHAAAAPNPAPHAVRGSPETVANLAAEIVKKLDGRSTRFDVELDPIGLGKVDVRVEIGAHGRMTAAMSFENPQAAAELKARSGELQRALEQAGFDLSSGLSFDVAGDRGQPRQEWNEGQGGGFRGRAFQQALETAGEADLAAAPGELRLRRGVTGGVDVRI